MTPDESLPLFIDSDNALGSRRGDIDDGLALAYLFRTAPSIYAVSAVGGNTSAREAYENTCRLASAAGRDVTCLAGSDPRETGSSPAAEALASLSCPVRVVALGPLTNISTALALNPACKEQIAELIIVGGNSRSPFRLPPLLPFEFNLTKDAAAAYRALNAVERITVVPLNQAGQVRFSKKDLLALEGPLGMYLRERAARWVRRARLLRLAATVPAWDLAAAVLVREPVIFTRVPSSFTMHRRGFLELGTGNRTLTLIDGIQTAAVWRSFVSAIARKDG